VKGGKKTAASLFLHQKKENKSEAGLGSPRKGNPEIPTGAPRPKGISEGQKIECLKGGGRRRTAVQKEKGK